jgi:2,4-didehydro-3-deoxy-L-rhamnonate hydrolase
MNAPPCSTPTAACATSARCCRTSRPPRWRRRRWRRCARSIGLNYADHAAETGNPIPKEPIVFHKTLSCMQGPDDDVMLPKGSKKTDWEVELGIVIGTPRATCRRPTRSPRRRLLRRQRRLRARVADRARRHLGQGQGLRHLRPVGPWLVTADEVPNPQALDMWLDVNGVRKQTGSTPR